MSIGDNNSNGNKGYNFPYQKNVLQGLQKLVDNADKGALNLIYQILSSTLVKPGRTTHGPGTVGTIPPGFYSYTITNVGKTNALLAGEPLYPGISETYDAGSLDNIMDGISYDTQSTTIQIITTTK